jgi:hypothetical protein
MKGIMKKPCCTEAEGLVHRRFRLDVAPSLQRPVLPGFRLEPPLFHHPSHRPRWRTLAGLCLLAGWLLVSGAQASDDDHDRARQAVEAGQVLPLPVVLERLATDYPGRVLEVELEQEDGRWQYEVKLLQRGGQLTKLKVDAQTGEVLSRKMRGDKRRTHP